MNFPTFCQCRPKNIARALASIYAAGLQHHAGKNRSCSITTDLPGAIWGRIAEKFDLDLSAGEIASMQESALVDPKNGTYFASDSEQKRQQATEAARTAVERWIYPVYEKLETVRLSKM